MPRRGENIRKRADGRWEGRYKYSSSISNAKTSYRSVYGKSYSEVKQKLLLIIQAQQINTINLSMDCTFSECMILWLKDISQKCKYSTYIKYQYISECHLKHFANELHICEITETMCEKYLIEEQYVKGRRLSLSTMKTICHVLNQVLKYGKSTVRIPIPEKVMLAYKYDSKEVATFSTDEQQKLLNFLYNNTDRYKLGIIICLFSGLRLGEICALKLENIDLSNKCIKISQTVQRIKAIRERKQYYIVPLPKAPVPFAQFHFVMLSLIC